MPRPVEINHLSPNFIWLSLHGHYLIQIIFLVAKIQLAYKSSVRHFKEWERIQASYNKRLTNGDYMSFYLAHGTVVSKL